VALKGLRRDARTRRADAARPERHTHTKCLSANWGRCAAGLRGHRPGCSEDPKPARRFRHPQFRTNSPSNSNRTSTGIENPSYTTVQLYPPPVPLPISPHHVSTAPTCHTAATAYPPAMLTRTGVSRPDQYVRIERQPSAYGAPHRPRRGKETVRRAARAQLKQLMAA
jgi:hypothetical protein